MIHFLQLWRPVFKKYDLRMPEQCPLHFSHGEKNFAEQKHELFYSKLYLCNILFFSDVFNTQELGKLQYRVNLWTCGTCGKSFYKESYLDMHIAKQHSHLVTAVSQTTKSTKNFLNLMSSWEVFCSIYCSACKCVNQS